MKTEAGKQRMASIVNEVYRQLQAQGLKQNPVDAAILGNLLLLAKKALPKRSYQPFLTAYTNLKPRTARRYIERMNRFVQGKHLEEPEPTEEELQIEKEIKELLLPGVKW